MTMVDDQALSEEMTAAATRATEAHKAVQRTSPTASDYQQVLNGYLQATILYMSIVSVCQARQHERLLSDILELTDEVADLRKQLSRLRPLVH